MTLCTICRTPLQRAETGRPACRACGYEIRAGLHELVLQLPLLEASIEPGRGLAVRGGHRATAPLPLRADVLDLLGPGTEAAVSDAHGDQTGDMPLATWLTSWAAIVAGAEEVQTLQTALGRHTPTIPPGTSGIPAQSRWLQAYVPYIAHQPYAVELHSELQDLIGRIRAITSAIPREQIKLAPCPACDGFSLLEVDGRWYIRCRQCPRMMTRQQYAYWQRSYAEDKARHGAFDEWMLANEREADARRADWHRSYAEDQARRDVAS